MDKPIKISIHYEYWDNNRLHSVVVMAATSVETLDLIARWGSAWENVAVSELNISQPGKLIISFHRG